MRFQVCRGGHSNLGCYLRAAVRPEKRSTSTLFRTASKKLFTCAISGSFRTNPYLSSVPSGLSHIPRRNPSSWTARIVSALRCLYPYLLHTLHEVPPTSSLQIQPLEFNQQSPLDTRVALPSGSSSSLLWSKNACRCILDVEGLLSYSGAMKKSIHLSRPTIFLRLPCRVSR